jgi:CubicO group peptidase (beta-lactamase class C family)
VRSVVDKELRWDTGTKFAYSDMAFEVLGDLVAKVSGVSMEDHVDEHILKPLGMTSSTPLIKKADPLKLAAGHSRGKDGEQCVSHNGGDDGFLITLVMVPARKFAFLWMTNCDYMRGGLRERMLEAALLASK